MHHTVHTAQEVDNFGKGLSAKCVFQPQNKSQRPHGWSWSEGFTIHSKRSPGWKSRKLLWKARTKLWSLQVTLWSVVRAGGREFGEMELSIHLKEEEWNSAVASWEWEGWIRLGLRSSEVQHWLNDWEIKLEIRQMIWRCPEQGTLIERMLEMEKDRDVLQYMDAVREYMEVQQMVWRHRQRGTTC